MRRVCQKPERERNMIQMGRSMPCLYEEMAAVPAMAGAQQGGNSSNSNNASQSYEQMLGTSSGAGSMSLLPQSGASGQFQPTPDKIEESRTVDKMAYNSWKGMLARNIGRAVIVSFLVGSQNTVVAVGTLQEVGSDYITIFHPGRSAYITADIYSIRFVEFPQGSSVVTLN